MRILVCDDQEDGGEATVNQLKSASQGCEVEGLFGDGLRDALTALFSGISEFLRTGQDSSWEPITSFAGYDTAVVDNNLSGLEFAGARLAAETIIGYLRAFTDITYIVSLNKNPNVDFDLRYLFGDYQSQADVALNTDHLNNARLWARTPPTNSFAPWYWPCLPDAAARRRRQIDLVSASCAHSIWTTLDFPEDCQHFMSHRAKARLESGCYDVRDATFRDFFRGTNALLPADTAELGRLAEEELSPVATQAVSRVVAGDLDRWLRRDVLAPQDVLIDIAHLLTRMPFLFEGTHEAPLWNTSLDNDAPPFGMKEDVYAAHVERSLFRADAWQPVPCFWWPILRQDNALSGMFLDSPPWPDVVFCEDTSTFVEIDDEGDGPLEFEAELEGSWPRRFVLGLAGKQYSPRSRFVA